MEHRVLAFLDRMNIKRYAHPIQIDPQAVIMQSPPEPETKEEAKAQAAIDAREAKAKTETEGTKEGPEKSSSAPHPTSAKKRL
jgi:hypothetical protein